MAWETKINASWEQKKGVILTEYRNFPNITWRIHCLWLQARHLRQARGHKVCYHVGKTYLHPARRIYKGSLAHIFLFPQLCLQPVTKSLCLWFCFLCWKTFLGHLDVMGFFLTKSKGYCESESCGHANLWGMLSYSQETLLNKWHRPW